MLYSSVSLLFRLHTLPLPCSRAFILSRDTAYICYLRYGIFQPSAIFLYEVVAPSILSRDSWFDMRATAAAGERAHLFPGELLMFPAAFRLLCVTSASVRVFP